MKKAVVVHSGGIDSTICLKLAILEFGADKVTSLTFDYGQRHQTEIAAAKIICHDWSVDHAVLNVNILNQITENALVDSTRPLTQENTLVSGRNGLMARLAALFGETLGAEIIYMGVIGIEESNSGYRDCSREYMDLKQTILRIDLGNENFEIRTPLVHMSKTQVFQLADSLGILEELLEKTVTCYQGLKERGCGKCPACVLKWDALASIDK